MKMIFEAWRAHGLEEAAKTTKNLANDDMKLVLLDMFPNTPDFQNFNLLLINESGEEVGNLEFGPAKSCPDVLVVYWVQVDQRYKGYGPLLYDVAMEWATTKKMGLASDREQISGNAIEIWEYYYSKRNDVRKKSISCPVPEEYRERWIDKEHPLRYVYYKEPDTIRELERLGRFKVESE